MSPTNKQDSDLLKLCVSAFDDGNLDKESFRLFSKDLSAYKTGGLTFRELIVGIRNPKNDLKSALLKYFSGTIYKKKY